LGANARVIATGGQASLLAGASRHIELVDEFLTLDGLRLLYARNPDVHPASFGGTRPAKPAASAKKPSKRRR
ncbi:MAG: hypothetical protein ACRD4T_08165, partial [Candidatus Acidiferrales bacterium]